jgi:hypothetical protein
MYHSMELDSGGLTSLLGQVLTAAEADAYGLGAKAGPCSHRGAPLRPRYRGRPSRPPR